MSPMINDAHALKVAMRDTEGLIHSECFHWARNVQQDALQVNNHTAMPLHANDQ